MGVVLALAFSPRAPKAHSQKSSPWELRNIPVAGPVEKTPLLHIDSESDFKTHLLDAKGICLVDLFSDYCPPCLALAPTIVSLAKRYTGRVTVCKVNVNLLPKVAEQYGIGAIPTVLIIKDGKEVKQLVGLRPEADYVALSRRRKRPCVRRSRRLFDGVGPGVGISSAHAANCYV